MELSKYTPLVSVIMPVYNGEKSCGRAIKSVINQTYRHIELIVINDGSTDGTLDIVRESACNDSRIVVVDQKNSGVSAARNRGLQEATCEFVVFIDADDYMDEFCIEKMLNSISRENSDIAICGYNSVNSDGRIISQYIHEGKTLKDIIENIVETNNINYLWNKMYRKDHISDLFNTTKMMGEDLEFNIRYFLHVNSISIVQDALYNYVVDSEGSLTKNSKLVWDAIASDWTCLNLLIDKDVDPGVINDKMMKHIFYIIQQQESQAKVKKLLYDIYSNGALRGLIAESNYGKSKFKIISLLIGAQAAGVLFWGSRIKNRIKKIL